MTAFTHGYGFDPAYGMGLAQLLGIAPPLPPSDFAAFWQRRYAAAMALSPHARLQPVGHRAGFSVHGLRYTSTEGLEIGGWLLVPVAGPARRGIVFGHGYGGCELPEVPLPVEDAVLLYPCFRGIGLSRVAGVSQDPNYHVLHNIQDRQRYILGGCVEDVWLAVSALLELFPQVAGQVMYSGISFGGGIGALAAPWDARISRLHLHVPTFGHQALRLTLPCVGSGESVRNFQRQHFFNTIDTLAYYDAANAAQFLRVPALVAAALFDPAVPPPGQFAIFNAISPLLRQLIVLQAGHFEYAGEAQAIQEMNQQVARFFTQP